MSVPLRLRRPLVILGVVLSLATGAATIKAAAAWTAASSPLVDKPPSVEALQADLAFEQARSADLLAQLEALGAGSAELAVALDAAREQVAADSVRAAELQANLDAAKARLAALERSIRQASAAGAARAAAVVAPGPAVGSEADSERERADEDRDREEGDREEDDHD